MISPQPSKYSPDPFISDLLAELPKLRANALGFTGNSAAADDLVQDTLIKALRYRDRFTPGTSLKAWLFIIQRNHFLSGARRQRWLAQDVDGRAAEALVAPSSPEWSLRYREVLGALDQLLPEQREALMLIVGGLSYEEAAEVMGCPPGTIKSRVSRGRETLARLTDWEGEQDIRPARPARRPAEPAGGMAFAGA